MTDVTKLIKNQRFRRLDRGTIYFNPYASVKLSLQTLGVEDTVNSNVSHYFNTMAEEAYFNPDVLDWDLVLWGGQFGGFAVEDISTHTGVFVKNPYGTFDYKTSLDVGNMISTIEQAYFFKPVFRSQGVWNGSEYEASNPAYRKESTSLVWRYPVFQTASIGALSAIFTVSDWLGTADLVATESFYYFNFTINGVNKTIKYNTGVQSVLGTVVSGAFNYDAIDFDTLANLQFSYTDADGFDETIFLGNFSVANGDTFTISTEQNYMTGVGSTANVNENNCIKDVVIMDYEVIKNKSYFGHHSNSYEAFNTYKITLLLPYSTPIEKIEQMVESEALAFMANCTDVYDSTLKDNYSIVKPLGGGSVNPLIRKITLTNTSVKQSIRRSGYELEVILEG